MFVPLKNPKHGSSFPNVIMEDVMVVKKSKYSMIAYSYL